MQPNITNADAQNPGNEKNLAGAFTTAGPATQAFLNEPAAPSD